jgi:uncharacterized Zn ribbon protein
MENVKVMRLNEVKEMFVKDMQVKPKNKTCNVAILELIDLINDNSKTIKCEIAKGGDVLNRGSVVECLIKLYLTNQKTTSKYKANKNDINLNGVGYEIKYTNSVAYASLSKKQKTEYDNKQYKPLIMVDSYGVYLSNTQYYQIAKNGKVKGVSKVLSRIVEW